LKKTILEVYALAVCFFAVACFVVTLGIGLYDIVQIVAPEFTLNRYQYERYQSNDAFRAAPDAIPGKDEKERKALSEEEITRRREAGYAQALRAERHDGKQSLLSMAIIMLVDAIAFVIHWEIGKKAR
jgi:hypothetical protein